jgi:hypothetical protein
LRKIHIGIDEQKLEIRAIEITVSNTGDAPMLPHLLSQIPRDQHIGSVTADGAYDTRRCHNASVDRGASAVISLGRRGSGAHRDPERLHCPWHPRHKGHGINLSGETGEPFVN